MNTTTGPEDHSGIDCKAALDRLRSIVQALEAFCRVMTVGRHLHCGRRAFTYHR